MYGRHFGHFGHFFSLCFWGSLSLSNSAFSFRPLALSLSLGAISRGFPRTVISITHVIGSFLFPVLCTFAYHPPLFLLLFTVLCTFVYHPPLCLLLFTPLPAM